MPVRGQASTEDPVFDGVDRAHNGLGRERIAGIQRARILTAMVDVVAERGAANAAVAHVVARSGVSRRTFYEVFEDREDCFMAAFEDALGRLAQVVADEEPVGAWRERIRGGLLAGLAFLDREPQTARLLVVETLGAGPRALERRARVVALLVETVDEGRLEGRGGNVGPVPVTAEGVVGGVLALLHRRLLEGQPLLELANPLMSMIVLPYLGPTAARRELDRPVPAMGKRPVRPPPDPLRELGMRLTYRTVRVLMAVAASPGSSNRTIGSGADIPDQGQTSKLLARLRALGLIENNGHSSAARRAQPLDPH